MHDLKPVQLRPQAVKTYLPKDLSTCMHTYVRTDAAHTPLQPTYTGLYRIIQRHDKHFTLDIHGRNERISIDRLKVFCLDIDLLPSSPSLMIPGPSSLRFPDVPEERYIFPIDWNTKAAQEHFIYIEDSRLSSTLDYGKHLFYLFCL